MEYTILILLLPLLSFLTLGIGGKWMTHRTAGIIGTTVLAVVALLSYATAWHISPLHVWRMVPSPHLCLIM